MPKTFAEIEAAFARALLDRFLRGAGLTAEQWAGFATAIPEDWAAAIAAETDGAVAVSDWPNVIHRPRTLTEPIDAVNSNEMETEHRISLARASTNRDRAFVAKVTAAGYTQGSLADKVGISRALLSKARSEQRAIRLSVAKRIEALTGFKATPANWPGGFTKPRPE